MWFCDSFPLLFNDKEVDFQIVCNSYNCKLNDLNNYPNVGFTYAKANKRTLGFYNYFYEERKRDWKMADQVIHKCHKI